MTKTIKIRNWDRWQSYRRDRGQPPWIKIHRKLMRDPNWVALSDAEKGQLIAMWLLAADNDGHIPRDEGTIQKLCYLDKKPDLQMFVNKGFLEKWRQDDANMTTSIDKLDATETETETEKEKEKNIKGQIQKFDPVNLDTEFDEHFWPAYPLRKAKPRAKVSFIKSRKAFSLDTIMAGVAAYIEHKPTTQAYAHPATWLNNERFNDEYFGDDATRKQSGHDAIHGAVAEILEDYARDDERRADPDGRHDHIANGARAYSGNVVDITPADQRRRQ